MSGRHRYIRVGLSTVLLPEWVRYQAQELKRGIGLLEQKGISLDIREALEDYVLLGAAPGNFISAVVGNDFFYAVVRADDHIAPRLADLARFLHNYAPIACWGSPANRAAWIERGGLRGPDVDE